MQDKNLGLQLDNPLSLSKPKQKDKLFGYQKDSHNWGEQSHAVQT